MPLIRYRYPERSKHEMITAVSSIIIHGWSAHLEIGIANRITRCRTGPESPIFIVDSHYPADWITRKTSPSGADGEGCVCLTLDRNNAGSPSGTPPPITPPAMISNSSSVVRYPVQDRQGFSLLPKVASAGSALVFEPPTLSPAGMKSTKWMRCCPDRKDNGAEECAKLPANR
jgi:hypothetical protein